MNSIVAKVGGSLFDLPELKLLLSKWIDLESPSKILFIGGGGALADAIRAYHSTHQLDEVASHWLAIHTMSINAQFLGKLLGLPVIRSTIGWDSNAVLDPYETLKNDDSQENALPHDWRVTSDSIAGRVAFLTGSELTLLKSANPTPEQDWKALALEGYVDHYFPKLIESQPIKVNCVNLRRMLQSH